jgi:glycosyltransferase involved in cell wall biosynthesis
MRVLVLTNQVPFIRGGAEIHADSLIAALRRAGHEAELVAVPYRWYPPEKVLDHLLACRMLDITESNGVSIDRVIGLRFPAYHIPHPCKVLWILHQHRTAFDLWGQPECDLGYEPAGREVREAIERVERTLLPTARAIFANSRNVAARLKQHCGVDSQPLYHPPRNAEKFYAGVRGDYFYYPSRLCELKRQELVLEALAKTREPVRMVFSGKPDNPAYFDKLKDLARRLKVENRVEWLGLVSDEEMWARYANCRGVIFPPKDEDYGYITLEAMLASKAVVTCTDSGGPLEFITDGVNGCVAAPTAESLAAAMDRLWVDEALAVEGGRRGRALIDELGINWPNVVTKLLA